MENTIYQPAEEQRDRNWAANPVGAVIAAGIVAAEVSPLNEAMRLGAYGLALKLSQGDVVAATVVAGGATMVIEGGAAIAAADLLDTDRGQSVTKRTARIFEKTGLRTNLATEAAIAFMGGSAVVTAVKHQQDVERSRKQNRKYGLTSASAISLFTMAEAFAGAKAIEHPNPVTIGAGALAVGAFVGAYKWSKNKLTDNTEVINKITNDGESPQRLGLSAEDKINSLNDPRTVYIEENGKKVPVLVPIDTLYWYNNEYLKNHFGTESIYYYAHPDLLDEESRKRTYDEIAELTSEGSVILYDTVTSGKNVYGDLAQEMTQQGKEYNKVPITKDGRQRFLYQYDGNFIISGGEGEQFKKTSTVHETYEMAVRRGDISVDPEEGPAIEAIIEGEEAERLWKIYRKPFERLSHAHPINSGYDKDEFFNILKDPEAVKAIYREKGEITTLALFVNDLDHCSWLDANYYKKKYPEAVETGNHFIFPGIVTDELKRGASFSVPLIQLIAKVQSLRKTPAVISFECSDISYKYIPRIVRFAIAKSGVAKTKGFKQPVSRFDYYAITK